MVPDAVRLKLPTLLAARLTKVGGVVVCAHHHRLARSAIQKARDFDGEGGVPAGVHDGGVAVDPDRRVVIYRAEVQQESITSIESRRLEGKTIPACAKEASVSDAAGGRLRAEGDANTLLK